jgi:hypothetical protein
VVRFLRRRLLRCELRSRFQNAPELGRVRERDDHRACDFAGRRWVQVGLRTAGRRAAVDRVVRVERRWVDQFVALADAHQVDQLGVLLAELLVVPAFGQSVVLRASDRLVSVEDFAAEHFAASDYRVAADYLAAVDSAVALDYRAEEDSVVVASASAEDYRAMVDCRVAVDSAVVAEYPAAADSPGLDSVAAVSAVADFDSAADYRAVVDFVAADFVLAADYPAGEASALAVERFRLSLAEVEEDSSCPCRPAEIARRREPASQ